MFLVYITVFLLTKKSCHTRRSRWGRMPRRLRARLRLHRSVRCSRTRPRGSTPPIQPPHSCASSLTSSAAAALAARDWHGSGVALCGLRRTHHTVARVALRTASLCASRSPTLPSRHASSSSPLSFTRTSSYETPTKVSWRITSMRRSRADAASRRVGWALLLRNLLLGLSLLTPHEDSSDFKWAMLCCVMWAVYRGRRVGSPSCGMQRRSGRKGAWCRTRYASLMDPTSSRRWITIGSSGGGLALQR